MQKFPCAAPIRRFIRFDSFDLINLATSSFLLSGNAARHAKAEDARKTKMQEDWRLEDYNCNNTKSNQISHASQKCAIRPPTCLIHHDEDASPHPPIVALGCHQGIVRARSFIGSGCFCSYNSGQGPGINCPAKIVCHPVQWRYRTSHCACQASPRGWYHPRRKELWLS